MPGKPLFTGIADCFRKTVAADGVAGLFKGLLPNMLKVSSSCHCHWLRVHGSEGIHG